MPEPPVLIAVAVALALVLALVLPRLRSLRRASSPEALGVPAYRPRSEEEELRELGIVGVRPRDGASPRVAAPDPDDDVPGNAPAPVVPRPPATVEASIRAPTRTRRVRRDDDLAPDEAMRATQEHLLNALLFSAGAHTVCLLREDLGTHLRYHIERIVSRNAYARSGGHFVLRTPLLADAPKRRTVLHAVGHGSAFGAENLGYYREPITGLREALVTPLTLGGVPHLLVADAMQAGRLDGPRARTLMEATARLLEHAPLPDGADGPSGDGLPDLAAGPSTPALALVAAEMDKAGAMGLALALVHANANPADHEALDGDALAEAEADLRARLADALPEGDRLERFGDHTFAVFLSDTSAALDRWADALHARLCEAYPEGHVAVGAVVHDGLAPLTADDLRGHALRALTTSFDEGQPVVLG